IMHHSLCIAGATVGRDQSRVDGIDPNTLHYTNIRHRLGEIQQGDVDRSTNGEFGGTGAGPIPAILAMLSLVLRKIGHAARVHSHITVKFQSEAVLQSSSVKAKKSARPVAPALFTSRSRRPQCPTAAAMACPGATGSRRSAGNTNTLTSAVVISVSAT